MSCTTREDGRQFFTASFTPDGFDCLRDIHVTNPNGVEKGVASLRVDGEEAGALPVLPAGSVCRAEAVMG